MPTAKIDFAALVQADRGKGPSCTMGVLLDELDPDLRAQVEAVLAQPLGKVWHTSIARQLTAIGHPIKEGPVAAHRKGECQCNRTLGTS